METLNYEKAETSIKEILLIDSTNVKAMDSLENIKVMVKNNIKTIS